MAVQKEAVFKFQVPRGIDASWLFLGNDFYDFRADKRALDFKFNDTSLLTRKLAELQESDSGYHSHE